MEHRAKSIRPFIGAKNFDQSRSFYHDLGFQETVIDENMSVFRTDTFAFYLQAAYVKDWIDNTMIFLEIDNADRHWKDVQAINLPAKYDGVRVTPIRDDSWGREYFLHDPSGVLWHFGEFR